ncbi:hypothetical protein FEM48_Zijuj07G0030000 [Ziziphus jujuba var. spinosa]|uniref:WW domain-containing protein n=1 Tax=Ziziphus jujuba var. spinosa TaxID=714518 RepID=A0A978V227_ZIZJJ|nr:hypothetical protein FEM48_Zijuj07G0030000 [Ziziphus jujuba var. spinosa]
MELPELSLAPTQLVNVNKSSMNISPMDQQPEVNSSRKRKLFHDHLQQAQASHVDLHQRKDPLPLDWEQCLDLESGKMYYLNRKTLTKSWNWPMEKKTPDLELNISTISDFPHKCGSENINHGEDQDQIAKKNNCSSGGSMVALPCLNCHLLVILSKSSPSCPNCKYVHSLPSHNTNNNNNQAPLPKVSPFSPSTP